jgi:type IV secretion system protein TrbI
MSAKKSKKPLDIETKPIVGVEAQTSSQVNKPLIFLIIAVVIVILVFVIIDAFQAPKKVQHSVNAPKNQGVGVQPDVVKKELSGLPSSYTDVKDIDRLLNRGHKGEISKKVQQEIDRLRQEQDALMRQVDNLKSKKKAPVDDSAKYTQSDLETMKDRSSIFPQGGTPPYVPYPRDDKAKTKAGESRSHYSSSYSSQNMQSEKDSFLSQKPSTDIYNKGKLQYPISKYILQAGTVFPAVLQTTLDSDNPGVVMARVRSDVYDSITGQYLLLPKGSKLLGNYNSKVAPGQSTLQIIFQRFIRPDGSSMMLSKALGVNDTGGTGISDTVDNHWMRLIGAAALMTVFNIPAAVQQNQAMKQQSSSGQLYGASAFGAASDSVNDIGQQVASQAIKIQPTVTIHAGKQFSAFVTKDIVIPPS